MVRRKRTAGTSRRWSTTVSPQLDAVFSREAERRGMTRSEFALYSIARLVNVSEIARSGRPLGVF